MTDDSEDSPDKAAERLAGSVGEFIGLGGRDALEKAGATLTYNALSYKKPVTHVN